MSPEEIKRTRRRLKFTQQQFADALHVSRETVARWEVSMARPKGLYLMALEQLAKKNKRRKPR